MHKQLKATRSLGSQDRNRTILSRNALLVFRLITMLNLAFHGCVTLGSAQASTLSLSAQHRQEYSNLPWIICTFVHLSSQDIYSLKKSSVFYSIRFFSFAQASMSVSAGPWRRPRCSGPGISSYHQRKRRIRRGTLSFRNGRCRRARRGMYKAFCELRIRAFDCLLQHFSCVPKLS
jgi:hypothetical protein